MNKIISTAMMLFVMMQASVAFADTDPVAIANATSNVVAGAAASADNNSVTTNTLQQTTTSGVTLAPGAVATNATAGASTSQIGDTSNVVNVQTGGTSLTFQASTQHIPPPAAFIPPSSGTTPQLFGNPGITAHEAGLALAMYYEEVCPSPAVRGYEDELMSRIFDGVSGNTEIIFVPHINSVRDTKPKPKEKRKWFRFEDDTPEKIEVEEVLPISFGKSGHYKCLGIVTVTAKDKEAGRVTPSVIMSDAKNFPLENMKGFRKISLLSMHSAIAITKGVDNNGSGLSVGGGLSQFFNPLLATTGASASSTSGMTYPGTKMGATFMVMVEVSSDDLDGVFIDLSPPKKPEEPKLTAIEPPAEISTAEIPPVVVPTTVATPPPVEVAKSEPAVTTPPSVIGSKTVIAPVAAVVTTKPKKRAVKNVPTAVVPVSYVINCERGVNCTVNLKDAVTSTPLPQPEPKKPETAGVVQREVESAGFFSKIFR